MYPARVELDHAGAARDGVNCAPASMRIKSLLRGERLRGSNGIRGDALGLASVESQLRLTYGPSYTAGGADLSQSTQSPAHDGASPEAARVQQAVVLLEHQRGGDAALCT